LVGKRSVGFLPIRYEIYGPDLLLRDRRIEHGQVMIGMGFWPSVSCLARMVEIVDGMNNYTALIHPVFTSLFSIK
jgi:hypothetical protein